MKPSLLVLVALCACGPGLAPFEGNNNSATLAGNAIGTAVATTDLLQRKIAVKATGFEKIISVVDAFVMRDRTSTENARLIVRVKNSNTRAHCFIRANNVEWKDAAGAVLTKDPYSFAQGAIGELVDVSTDTCLAAGATGYLRGIELSPAPLALFSQTSSLELSWTISNSPAPTNPDAKLVPSSYAFDATGLAVSFSNQGTKTGKIASYSHVILLDAQAQPVGWTFVNKTVMPTSGVFAAGATGTTAATLSFEGSSSSLVAFIDYEDCPTCLREQPVGSADEVQRAQLSQWNQAQRQKDR